MSTYDSDIERLLWTKLTEAKMQSSYYSNFNRKVRNFERIFNILIAILSAVGIGGLAVSCNFEKAWTYVLAGTQLLTITKPFVFYFKDLPLLTEAYLRYEQLFLQLEKLWHEYRNDLITEEETAKQLFNLKNDELKIIGSLKEIRVRDKKAYKVADAEMREYISVHYQQESQP